MWNYQQILTYVGIEYTQTRQSKVNCESHFLCTHNIQCIWYITDLLLLVCSQKKLFYQIPKSHFKSINSCIFLSNAVDNTGVTDQQGLGRSGAQNTSQSMRNTSLTSTWSRWCCGSETWRPKHTTCRLETSINICLRQVLNIWWRDNVHNRNRIPLTYKSKRENGKTCHKRHLTSPEMDPPQRNKEWCGKYFAL